MLLKVQIQEKNSKPKPYTAMVALQGIGTASRKSWVCWTPVACAICAAPSSHLPYQTDEICNCSRLQKKTEKSESSHVFQHSFLAIYKAKMEREIQESHKLPPKWIHRTDSLWYAGSRSSFCTSSAYSQRDRLQCTQHSCMIFEACSEIWRGVGTCVTKMPYLKPK